MDKRKVNKQRLDELLNLEMQRSSAEPAFRRPTAACGHWYASLPLLCDRLHLPDL